jgi:two-component system sensor histidine kinase VanS
LNRSARVHRGKKEADYSKFTRRILLQSTALAFAALVVIYGLYLFVWRGNVGTALVWLFQFLFNMSEEGATHLYQFWFRSNSDLIFLAAFIITFLVLLRISLKRFTRYFDVINNGIDALVDDKGDEIVLIPEMAATERKLNTVRLTLEQRAREAQLAEQRKNDLVMYIAHDIRTPLTSIIGYLSLLEETPDMPAEQRARHIRIALDKANRLEQLINEFFEITRFNAGSIALAKQMIDLHYMLLQITDEFYPQLSARGTQIDLQVDEGMTLYGDPDKLARVFNNILRNAIAYGDENGTISIAAKRCNERVSVVFTNTGSIPQEKLSRIFEKFERLDNARSSGTGGAGLGLAIAREIVILHGGNLFAHSHDNQTAFTVELPSTAATPPLTEAQTAAQKGSGDSFTVS